MQLASLQEEPMGRQAEKVSENDNVKIMWDFRMQTKRHLELNAPDIVVIEPRNSWITDIAISGNARVEAKELEIVTIDRDLALKHLA